MQASKFRAKKETSEKLIAVRAHVCQTSAECASDILGTFATNFT